MDNVSNVVLLVQNSHMSSRISGIIQEVKGTSHETQESLKFLNKISELENDISLVIIDIDMGTEAGFSIVEKIKRSNPQVPIIVLTSNNKKETFLKSITTGAADFILKPFEDDFLKERIKIFMPINAHETRETTRLISKNLDEYVNSEISKANKGKYSFSVLMTTFFLPTDVVTLRQENEYRRLSGDLHKKFSELFWVTDVFIQYGTQSFIGIFPFCDMNSTGKVHDKIMNSFDEIKNSDVRLTGYHIANAFVTYPEDGANFVEIMDKLTLRMKQTIVEIKNIDN
jgi:DNA-binding response OmpR family regulator